MSEHEVRPAKLSVETAPATGPNGENASCAIHIEGSTNDLLNAFQNLTSHLFETLIGRYGKDVAMGMYATVQVEALKAIGIDPEKEVEEKIKIHKQRIDALMSILGKTFTMDGEEVKDGDEE